MVVTTQGNFEVNGAQNVKGVLRFEWGKVVAGERTITLECPTEFLHALVCSLSTSQSNQLKEFFSDSSILSWKVVIMPDCTNMDTIFVLIFAREPELILHLSIAADIESRHFEIPLCEIGTKLMAFFSDEK